MRMQMLPGEEVIRLPHVAVECPRRHHCAADLFAAIQQAPHVQLFLT